MVDSELNLTDPGPVSDSESDSGCEPSVNVSIDERLCYDIPTHTFYTKGGNIGESIMAGELAPNESRVVGA